MICLELFIFLRKDGDELLLYYFREGKCMRALWSVALVVTDYIVGRSWCDNKTTAVSGFMSIPFFFLFS